MRDFKKVLFLTGLLALVCLPMTSMSQSVKITSYPVDISSAFNVDGFMVDANDGTLPDTLGLDGGGARVQSETLPADFVDGEPNYTEQGDVQFLLGPTLAAGTIDAYRPDGTTFDIAEKIQYDAVYLALMSGNGNFPGSAWAGQDNMTITYTDGSSQEIAIGLVNDWFWSPPTWFKPESGNEDEILVNLLCHESDLNEPNYIYEFSEDNRHDYGQYRYVNGDPDSAFLVYRLPYEAGAKLYLEMWGNYRVVISKEPPYGNPDAVEMAKVETPYPGGGDGYNPNRDKYVFDPAEYISDLGDEFYIEFTDAFPGEAPDGDSGNWGARIHRIALFTGPVVETSTGDRLFPDLIRSDGASPDGGLILIKKTYPLDGEKAVDSITMPNLFPNAEPYLTCFGMTLGVIEEGTGIESFMLY
ncbi:MAG: hypothetical protein JXR73_20550 [Candidatus Omnitrophica bacterium]|nr:hypothetical protein [Candidatus Omnitrophota bacterium]